ncbi:hypothetical protein TSL1_19120 [Sulfurovum sp. TSL1]|nr:MULTISPECIES: DUF302 domain-containing protein [unclassified Sulfurovum]GIT99091.1 hypothetical protein TSL1_19120 [Sulfurovum sp. TSL1]GIU01556.1 hypothetical protein TSL6_20620 [Sulfurovum sp. TSL6]
MKDHSQHDRSTKYKENSMTLVWAVSMGTGVMIGAGILALTGQIAELAGPFFPLVFLAVAVVTAFSAYSYIKMSNAYPSARGHCYVSSKSLTKLPEISVYLPCRISVYENNGMTALSTIGVEEIINAVETKEEFKTYMIIHFENLKRVMRSWDT